MDGFILLSALVAFGIFGYYIMARIDRFLESVRKQNGAHCLTPEFIWKFCGQER